MGLRGAWVVAAVAVGLSAACSREQDAKDEFSKEFTCPPAGVESRARPDIDLYDLIHQGDKAEQPSAEIAADPARLAMWKKQRADETADARSSKQKSYALYEVRGCGHTALYECYRGSRGNGGVSPCSVETRGKYAPGNPAW